MATRTMHHLPSSGLAGSMEEEEWKNCKTAHKDFLWKELVRDPSKWWDYRNSKSSPRYPDFKHKDTRQPLWMDSWDTPSWVSEELHDGIPCAAFPDPPIHSFVAQLRACAKSKDLYRGARIHNELSRRGLLEKCSDALVTMYAKCGELSKAKALLDMHKSSDVITWTALIAGYAREGRAQNALDYFDRMQHDGILPDAVTYACILKACATIGAIDKGKQIHEAIVRQGLLQNDIVLGGALVNMYAKCGALSKAQHVLEGLPSQNSVLWGALIVGYVQKGQAEQALKCFERMQQEGILLDAATYVCILKACAIVGATDKGKQIHDLIARQGLLQNHIMLGGALVDMYAKCGALSMAQSVLEGLSSRNVVSWNTLIAGYAQEGQAEQALNCYEQMQREGILPDAVTYACVLKACAIIGAAAADMGKQIHDVVVRQGLLQNDIVLGSALVDMYAKCGVLSMSQCVLEGLPSRDVVSWSALIAGYAQEGQAEQALNCFEQMQLEGILPDAVTYTCILKACATIGAIDQGKKIHAAIVRQGLLRKNIVLGGALVDMYAKCGALSMAQRVFEGLLYRNVVSWSALIAGYTQEGQAEQALNCFEQMQHEGILPNAVTYASILRACATIGAADKGKEIHDEIAMQGLLQNNIVLGNALVDMYAKSGALSMAQHVLEGLPSRDVVSWSALIAGYVQEGQAEHALNCFEQMQCEGIHPDAVTFACVLHVCSHLGLVEEGQTLFLNMSTKYDVKPDLECYTCMVDLFGRAGHLEKAVQLIHEMPSSDHSVIWIALLGACQKWGEVNVGRWAFERAVQLDKSIGSAYILMANIYAAAGMQEKAKNIEAMRIRNRAWQEARRSWWVGTTTFTHAFSVGDPNHAQSRSVIAKLEHITHKMSQYREYVDEW